MENSPVSNQDEQNAVPVPDQALPSAPEPFVPFASAEASGQVKSSEYKDEGWSWGGFAFNWIFLVAVRKYTYLFFLLLMPIPLINIIALLGMMIFAGTQGRELARESRTFANHEQYLGFMKGVDHAGKVIALFYLIAIGIGIIIAGIFLVALQDFGDYTYENDMRQVEMKYPAEINNI
jgi:hypothetical protein